MMNMSYRDKNLDIVNKAEDSAEVDNNTRNYLKDVFMDAENNKITHEMAWLTCFKCYSRKAWAMEAEETVY